MRGAARHNRHGSRQGAGGKKEDDVRGQVECRWGMEWLLGTCDVCACVCVSIHPFGLSRERAGGREQVVLGDAVGE